MALGLVLALLLCACQPPEGMYSTAGQDLPPLEVVPIKVWCSEESVGIITEAISAYTTQNSTINYDIVVEVKSEEEAAKVLREDAMSAPEVFAYTSAQVNELIDASAFTLVTRSKSTLMEHNSAGAIAGAKPDEWLYGYPVGAESEMLLFYDTSVVGQQDVASLEAVIAAAKGAGKGVYMDLADGATLAGFFLGAGCTLGYNRAGKQVCNFDSEEGLLVYEAITGYAPDLEGGGAEAFVAGAGSHFAAGIASSDHAEALKTALGSNYGVAPLPSFSLGGEEAPLYSLGSYRYLGLRKMMDVDLAPYVMDLCFYLVSAENQYQRAQQLEWAATDLNVLEYPEYTERQPTLAAMTRQGVYSAPLSFVPAGYQQAAAAFARDSGFSATADAQALLAALCEAAVQ